MAYLTTPPPNTIRVKQLLRIRAFSNPNPHPCSIWHTWTTRPMCRSARTGCCLTSRWPWRTRYTSTACTTGRWTAERGLETTRLFPLQVRHSLGIGPSAKFRLQPSSLKRNFAHLWYFFIFLSACFLFILKHLNLLNRGVARSFQSRRRGHFPPLKRPLMSYLCLCPPCTAIEGSYQYLTIIVSGILFGF